jgi:putative ABC transport system ATP-binding protein
MQIVFCRKSVKCKKGCVFSSPLHWKQMTEPRLELRAVSKTYRNGEQASEVLHGISLTATAGSITALLGRSGCGKTTLLNLAGAMDFPSAGEVLIDGRATTSLSESELTALRRGRVGFVFQFFQLLPTLTVIENVELPLLLAGTRNSLETARGRLRWVGLEDKAAVMPYQLSGGQMQRVAIARALVNSPDLLIADEPTGNLDTASGDQVLALIRESASRFGATVLMATHSAEAAAIADTRVILRDGRVQAIEHQASEHQASEHQASEHQASDRRGIERE